ncbi:MAG: 4-hydroxythreonine-4-phosphate dehydrogenase PdxA [Proteobacteria bacterium]|nr:4-hydroxythreonine-4-phosphate dehydrogenase PdxA [Pseudomonadota bacterium]
MTPTDNTTRRAAIAVTMGEPAGIGGEIALLAWVNRSVETPPFFVIDDPDRLLALADLTGIGSRIEPIDSAQEASTIFRHALPVLPLGNSVPLAPGKPDPQYAASVIRSIDMAIDLVGAGEASAIVTNPIHKSVLYDAGFSHPGHTEYLADRAKLTTPSVMMLVCPALRVVPTTIHLSLSKAIENLTVAKIVHCARLTANSLQSDFGIALPRIVIAALNPHAGEDGHLGREEIDIIRPAVDQLLSENFSVSGPFPADTLFHPDARKRYDAVICMYHDQALIPLKTIDFDRGVNVTLGLPYVRTSPDHGTAFDIAGTGQANPASFIAAVRLADQMSINRRAAKADRRVA